MSVPFYVGTNIYLDICHKSYDDFEVTCNAPYASVFNSLMYAIVCTRLDISQAMRILRKFMSNHVKEN